MQPSQWRHLSLRMANMLFFLALSKTSVLVTLSCHQMRRMHWRLLKWKLLSFLCICGPCFTTLHTRSVLCTQAGYVRSLAFPVRLGLFQTLWFSLAITAAALAILLFTSALRESELETVDQRFVKLSKTSRLYPSVVMFGNWWPVQTCCRYGKGDWQASVGRLQCTMSKLHHWHRASGLSMMAGNVEKPAVSPGVDVDTLTAVLEGVLKEYNDYHRRCYNSIIK